jgi:hypothetical protein
LFIDTEALNEAVIATVLPYIVEKTKQTAAIQPIIGDLLHLLLQKLIRTSSLTGDRGQVEG